MSPVIPAYVAPLVIAAFVVLAASVARIVARAAADAALPDPTRRRVALTAAILLGAAQECPAAAAEFHPGLA